MRASRNLKYAVWKYQLNLGVTELSLPKGAEVIKFDFQGGTPTLWAVVNTGTDADTDVRRFCVYGTGHQMQQGDIERTYVGTGYVLESPMGQLVFHCFEEKVA